MKLGYLTSVAYYAENEEIKRSVLASDAIRRETLKACYSIEGYAALPLNEKNAIYDAIKKGIILLLEGERQ